MDIVAITLFMYLVTALALGAVSNYLRPIWMWLASTLVILGAYMFGLFLAPPFIFLFFYAVPYSVGRFSSQLIRRSRQASAKLEPSAGTAG